VINTELIKERVSLEDAFEFLGMDWPRSKKILCPFHDERTPSCHLYAQQGRVHCFGCGQGGDVIELVMAVQKWDFVRAATELAAFADIEGVNLEGTVPKDRSADDLLPVVADQAHADVVKWTQGNVSSDPKLGVEFIDSVFEVYDETMRQHRNGEISSPTAIRSLLEWRAQWKSRLR